MVREIRGVLSLGDRIGWRVPIVKTEAARGEGVEKLEEHRADIEAEGTLSERRRNLRNEVLGLCAARLHRRLKEHVAEGAGFPSLLDEVVARRLDPASAASTTLERFDAGEAA
jgi:GTPase